MEKIKVVYLTGFWFSGATILGRSLKSSEDVIYVGEIRDFWSKGLKKMSNAVVEKDLQTVIFGQR